MTPCNLHFHVETLAPESDAVTKVHLLFSVFFHVLSCILWCHVFLPSLCRQWSWKQRVKTACFGVEVCGNTSTGGLTALQYPHLQRRGARGHTFSVRCLQRQAAWGLGSPSAWWSASNLRHSEQVRLLIKNTSLHCEAYNSSPPHTDFNRTHWLLSAKCRYSAAQINCQEQMLPICSYISFCLEHYASHAWQCMLLSVTGMLYKITICMQTQEVIHKCN